MEDKNLNMKREMNGATAEELRKAEVEREMKKIRERMQQRLRDANTEASLKRQEEQQKAKVEALRQKLKRERQAQIIKEMAEKNAVNQKAAILASQIAAREEQKAREAGKTSNFDAEEKKKQMMNAYNIQRSKANNRALIHDEVNLELAEDDLKEIEAAQERMKNTENYMQELREEQAKKIEEEKAKKTNAIKNIFNKLTSWPRRKIPTQEELSNDGLKEGVTTANSEENNKDVQEERVSETLEMSKDIPNVDKEKIVPSQESSKKLSYQDKNLKELYDKAVELKKMTREEADKSFKEGRESARIKKQAEEARKEAEVAKEKEKQKLLHKRSYAAQQYISKLFNSGSKLSRKDTEKTKDTNKRKRDNMMSDLEFSVDEQLAVQKCIQKEQENKEKQATSYLRPGWSR